MVYIVAQCVLIVVVVSFKHDGIAAVQVGSAFGIHITHKVILVAWEGAVGPTLLNAGSWATMIP